MQPSLTVEARAKVDNSGAVDEEERGRCVYSAGTITAEFVLMALKSVFLLLFFLSYLSEVFLLFLLDL